MAAVTIDGPEHDRAGHRRLRNAGKGDDAALVTAELPVVSDADLAPPFPDEPGGPVPPTDPAAAAETDRKPAGTADPESGSGPLIVQRPKRVIVIGDADERATSVASTGATAPTTPTVGGGSRAVLPTVTPGPAVIKASGPLVFDGAGIVPVPASTRPAPGPIDERGSDDPIGIGFDPTTTTAGTGDASFSGLGPGPGVDPRAEPRVVVIGDVDANPPEVAIDPRIKARRTQVKRSAGLRRLRAGALIAFAFALVFGGGTALRSYVLVVRKVFVTGTSSTPAEMIQSAVNSVAGRSMVDVSLVDLRKRFEQSPWVKSVDVTRDWPSTIRVDVLERRPVAYFRGRDDHGYVVDDAGLVLVLTDGAPVGLMEVTGDLEPAAPGQPAADTVRAGAVVANALPAPLRPLVAAIDSKPTGVALRMAGTKSQILLGGTDDLATKLITVLAFQGTCPPGSYDTLDVRVPGKPAVTPAVGCKVKK